MGPRASAWCLLVHAEASLFRKTLFRRGTLTCRTCKRGKLTRGPAEHVIRGSLTSKHVVRGTLTRGTFNLRNIDSRNINSARNIDPRNIQSAED
jgi:hypothetical protein